MESSQRPPIVTWTTELYLSLLHAAVYSLPAIFALSTFQVRHAWVYMTWAIIAVALSFLVEGQTPQHPYYIECEGYPEFVSTPKRAMVVAIFTLAIIGVTAWFICT